MKNELLTQHFRKSGFDEMQADALTAYFSQLRDEMTTKQDLASFRTEMKADIAILHNEMTTGLDALRREMTTGQGALRREMTTSQGALRNEVAASLNGLRTEIATLKGDLTWRFVALVVFLSTVTTLLSIFVQ